MKGISKDLREYMLEKKEATLGEIYSVLNYDKNYDKRAIRLTIRDFIRRGEIVKDGERYMIVTRDKGMSQADKIWRAMRYLRIFTVQDLAQLTDIHHRYICDVLKRYKRQGYVHTVGVRDGKNVYALDGAMRERPALKKWHALKEER